MSTHQQILEMAETLFFRFGVKSVTMDDVAAELGISKKTLYQAVPTKAELIDQIVENHIRAEVAMIEDQRARSANAIDEMLAITNMVGETLGRITPLLLFDLRKYYRQTWVKINQLHRDHIFQIIRRNLEKGQAEGLYRLHFDPAIIARLYVVKALAVIDEKIFPHDQLDMSELVRNHLTYHLHGVLSDAGRQYLQTQSSCASGISS
ncbi:MAG: TetR/AcrR family transcriptional regulator [Saprospiraceae bacterium]|nr:TetR/AcrR family transcriptional regulator [Saprospiraceae bacterium]